MTLARIFLLTQEHQSLIREITTPSLAPFITAALNSVKTAASSQTCRASTDPSLLLPSVLQAFSELVVLHPASFRPFLNQIQALILPFIAPTPSHEVFEENPDVVPQITIQAAQQLFTLLHVCAPKNTAAEEWSKSLQSVIETAHKTTDKVFRGFVEVGRPRVEKSDLRSDEFGKVLSDRKPQPLGLPGWVGATAGIERLNGLLNIMRMFLLSSTSTTVSLPVSNILNLVNRTLAALPSSRSRSSRWRPEIGRDEREAVEIGLPQLHASAIRILSSLMSRMGSGCMSLMQRVLEQILWVLDNEYEYVGIRETTYSAMSQILQNDGLTLSSSYILPVCRSLRRCCEDLLPSNEPALQESEDQTSKSTVLSTAQSSATNADSYLNSASKRIEPTASPANVQAAAKSFLQLALTNLPRGFLSGSIRNRIDRTIILTGNKNGMLSSVMNPPVHKNNQQSTTSILPMLARAHTGSLDFEALVRPQMPLLQVKKAVMGEEIVDEEEESRYEDMNGSQGGQFDDDFPVIHESTLREDSAPGANENSEAPIAATYAKNHLTSTDTGDDSAVADFPPSIIDSSSNKRARDTDMSLDVSMGENEATSARNATPTEEEMSSKRVRLTPGEIDHDHQPGNVITHSTVSQDQPIAAIDAQPLLTRSSNEVEHLDSDESDFEQPILYLDPDSDEEDEEDDEEEDD